MDEAARERKLVSGSTTELKPAVRWLAVAMVAVAPIALVAIWVLVVR